MSYPYSVLWTIWRFKSVDGKQAVTSVRHSEPNDLEVQHGFQRVLWRGAAHSREHALTLYAAERSAA